VGRTVTHTYSVAQMRDTLREALTTKEKGPKVVVAQSECMLNRQRREKPEVRQPSPSGRRVVRERFGVDPDTCTGDHSCIRLSGCPSLTIKPTPIRSARDPVASRDRQLRRLRPVRRGGARGRAVPVVLPRADRQQPHGWDRFCCARLRSAVIGWLQPPDRHRRRR
jgi:indolepyruvate ferredoxin oxidoreductase alpha subunit